MFTLHNITMTNFRSYLGTHEFEFPTGYGLYFLAGENKAQSSLGANGAGKSTFLDAITWVLFGRTTRGLKANEVVSWGATSTAVTLELTVGDQRAQIQRTQKPNGLFLDGKAVDQEELQKYLRLNYDSFKYSVLNAQFTTSFFALQATEKLTLFSDIMDLNFWLECSKLAATKATKLQTDIDEFVAAINRYDGQVLTIAGDIQDLKTASMEYEKKRAVRTVAIKQEAIDIYAEIKISKSRLKKLVFKRTELRIELKALLNNLSDLEETRDVKMRTIEVMGRKHKDLENDQSRILNLLQELTTGNGWCDHCLQKVSEVHLTSRKHSLEKSLTDITVAQINTSTYKKDAIGEVAKLRLKINNLGNQCHTIRSAISDLDIKDTKLQVKLNTVNQRLDDIGVKLDEAETGDNPHETMLIAKQTKLKELKKYLTDAIESKDKLEVEYEATKFWIKGFKRVRLFIIEQAFETLEIEVNNVLAQLGMPDWQITFDAERENKSGGITKGFVVFIKGPKNSEPVKWENWSGGETQRLQLAGDLGLTNLITQRAGLRNTIEFYDEPSTHLSPEGMMDLADMLHERAIEEGKCIWIVDHTSITNFGEFEGIITARKDENGSSITTTS